MILSGKRMLKLLWIVLHSASNTLFDKQSFVVITYVVVTSVNNLIVKLCRVLNDYASETQKTHKSDMGSATCGKKTSQKKRRIYDVLERSNKAWKRVPEVVFLGSFGLLRMRFVFRYPIAECYWGLSVDRSWHSFQVYWLIISWCDAVSNGILKSRRKSLWLWILVDMTSQVVRLLARR